MTQILDRICIQMVFIEFQKFKIFCRVFLDFWLKKNNFFCWSGKNFGKKTWTENRTCSRKMVQLVHKLVKMFPRVQATKLWIKFLISDFFLILRLPKCNKRAFLLKNRQFYPKITLFAHFGCHKIRKKTDIKNLIHNFVACTLGYIFTNLWTN